ncbi:NnrU family protein [Microvirga sp. 3-52]|uniref:NnrU family protein n=1 Tax=Microvirga sp. 3-52 TaxID=2792425 RepID=UPI001AC02A9F|nr:NnrU family protein [Microvirga sp. 3-52]MBO1908181.1 NnrU family protein [Microvirga sp. 3-52]MBS7454592.1 NnrU family protein [Microvirga sp. 3-52]
MLNLAAAALTFFALHRIVSGSSVRDHIVGLIGERPFRRVFALASLACLIWLWLGFLSARNSPWNGVLFAPHAALVILQLPLQLLAILLIVAGVTTRNPTIAGMGAAVSDRGIVRGVLRISRHPFLWGIALFAVGHMLVVPNVAAWGFFGALLVLALTGTLSIDAKRHRAHGDDWTVFAAATSNLPFQAIATGRQRLKLREIGWRRPLLAVTLYGLLVLAHPYLFGVSAVP